MKEAEATSPREEAGRNSNRPRASYDVVILGTDVVVGRTLKLLLQGGGYDVKFVADTSLVDSEMLEDAGLLILTPELDADWRRDLLSSVNAMSEANRVPILELIVYSRQKNTRPRHRAVPWPCPVEDLKIQIESVRLTADYRDKAVIHSACEDKQLAGATDI